MVIVVVVRSREYFGTPYLFHIYGRLGTENFRVLGYFPDIGQCIY